MPKEEKARDDVQGEESLLKGKDACLMALCNVDSCEREVSTCKGKDPKKCCVRGEVELPKTH